MALFGCCCLPPVTVQGLFDLFPIGRNTTVGVDNGFWTGAYGGIQDGVALLTNAQFYNSSGTPVGPAQPVVRIPLAQIQYVV